MILMKEHELGGSETFTFVILSIPFIMVKLCAFVGWNCGI